MLEKATAQKELLVSRGMAEKLLEDLAAALGEFEQTLEATRAGGRDHVGASADLQAVAAEMAEHVRLLDGMVRYRFGDHAELMGAWASARNPSLRSGQAVLGPFRSRVGEEGTPGPGEVAPAA